MWRDSLLRRATAIVLGVCFLFQVSGCTSWKAQQAPPGEVLAEKSYNIVRVIQNDSSRVEVFEPKVADDTLSGFSGGPSTSDKAKAVRIALSDIRYVEVRRGDTGKTVLLVAGIGVSLLLLSAIALSNMDLGGGYGSGTSSCPFLYSWDGQQWRLDSGTFGGAVMPGLQRTELDNLGYATPSLGVLRLKLANELREIDFIDQLSVLAVDHPRGVSVLPDASGLALLHAVGRLDVPRSARDAAGRDQLSRIGVRDGVFWESGLRSRDPALPADQSDELQLSFRRPAGATTGTLVLDAQNTPWAAHLMVRLVQSWGRDVTLWYDPASAAAVARQVGPALTDVGSMSVEVKVGGRWETRGRVQEIGPELTKRVALPLDLTGVTGDRVEVRLLSTPNFWLVDYAGLDFAASAPFTVRELALESALDARGIERWSELEAPDGRYYIMDQHDQAELTVRVPPVPSGMARSYVARATGWYRIEGAESSPPDAVLLEKMSAPGGATRIALELSNQALAGLR